MPFEYKVVFILGHCGIDVASVFLRVIVKTLR